MLLRSGKIKHTSSKCYNCNEYYGNKKFRYKCYRCYKNLPNKYPWKTPEFRRQVNQWAINELNKSDKIQTLSIIKKLIKICYTKNDSAHRLLYTSIQQIHNEYKSNGKNLYISAKDGAHILRNVGVDCNQKSHIICPLILDWWNMKKYNFNNTELCYFGRYGDEKEFEECINTIPPPKPNVSFLFC